MPVLFIAGLLVLLLGLILFFSWFGFILILIKALLPAFLMAGGAVAAYLGWEEWRDKRRTPNLDFSSPVEASRYQAEAAVYQAQINEIKSGGAVEAGKVEAAEETAPDDGSENKTP